MRYTVVWLPAAEARLATLWMAIPDRLEFSEAVNRIDAALRDDPIGVSIPLGKFQICVDHPIAVMFHVDPGDRMVRVLQVRRLKP